MLWSLGRGDSEDVMIREGFSAGEPREKEQPSKPLTSELSQKKEGAATGRFLRQEGCVSGQFEDRRRLVWLESEPAT